METVSRAGFSSIKTLFIAFFCICSVAALFLLPLVGRGGEEVKGRSSALVRSESGMGGSPDVVLGRCTRRSSSRFFLLLSWRKQVEFALPVSPPSSAAAKTCKFASQSFLLRPAMEAWGGVCAARAPCLGQGGVSKLLLRQALSAVDKFAAALS
jgi:hypothetical protein